MKGPYERLKYDLRRVWECSECHHRERSDGRVTFRFCRCQRKKKLVDRTPMKLVEDGPRRRADESRTTEAPEPSPTPNEQVVNQQVPEK